LPFDPKGDCDDFGLEYIAVKVVGEQLFMPNKALQRYSTAQARSGLHSPVRQATEL
jgi:hypothetical protein